MAILGFERDTLVDAAVNAVPLAILLVFMGLFLLLDPWPDGLLSLVLGQGLLLVPFVVLVVATAVAARLIQADEAAD